MVLRVGSSAVVSVAEVRWFDLVVVVVVVSVCAAQPAKLKATRAAITPLAIDFILRVLLHQRFVKQASAASFGIALQIFSGNRMRRRFVLPINIHDPPALAVVK